MNEAPRAATFHNTRSELFRDGELTKEFGVIVKPLTVWERLYNNGALRKTLLILVLGATWEWYAPSQQPSAGADAQRHFGDHYGACPSP